MLKNWTIKQFHWEHKPLIKASVPTLFHIPSQKILGKKITNMMKQVEDSNKMVKDNEDILLLFAEPHPFRSDMYISVTDQVPHTKNVRISGTFMAKVFDGSYKAVPKFMKQIDTCLGDKNKKAENYYVHYAYFPKCAEEANHNYIVFFAEIKE